jgi:hypothetical protein
LYKMPPLFEHDAFSAPSLRAAAYVNSILPIPRRLPTEVPNRSWDPRPEQPPGSSLTSGAWSAAPLALYCPTFGTSHAIVQTFEQPPHLLVGSLD